MARFLSLALLAVLVVGLITPLEAAPKMSLYEKNLNDVITVVKAKPGYKAFASLVGAILKQSQLKSLVQQNLTIFVPNDKALNDFNLTQYATADLLKVVKYHAVKGTYTFAQLQALAASGGKLQTTFGMPISLTPTKKGIGMFGMEKIGAAVLDKDISIKPTVVAQGISRVLKPKGFVIKGASAAPPASKSPANNDDDDSPRAARNTAVEVDGGSGESGGIEPNGSAAGDQRGCAHGGEAGEAEEADEGMEYAERRHKFPGGQELLIREFSFHPVNANLLWPGAMSFADWLAARPQVLAGARVLEIGSGTGALAIFLSKAMGCDITTCDYNDASIAANIHHNCLANSIEPLPHIRHTWGEPFPISQPSWDVIIASDVLLYVKEYPNLVKTLRFLLFGALKSSQTVQGKASRVQKQQRYREQAPADVALTRPCFVMSWRRRIPREDEEGFFRLCEEAGMSVVDLGSRVFCIAPIASD
ncbi:unnamed protein product [Closterium sp. NIES-65]|nr:unnamed protein product [Closterium sp. NIES-65]